MCVYQRKSWKRRFFTLDDNAVSYYKSEMVRRQTVCIYPLLVPPVDDCGLGRRMPELCLRMSQDKEPLRAVPLRDIQKVHECLVKSG